MAQARASQGFFTASDGTRLFVRTFEPPEQTSVRAVVHVAHGLGEHGTRYARLAEALAAEGCVVVAHDARGHGETASIEGSSALGRLSVGVVPRMVADLCELLAASHKARPGLRYFIFGHSFGTVVGQLAAASGAAGVPLAGLVLSGPLARIPTVMGPAFKALVAGLQAIHGEHGVSKIPGKLSFDKFQAQCMAAAGKAAPSSKDVTGWEWLNRDQEEVQKYVADPFCGIDMSIGFWRSAVPAMLSLKSPATHAKLPPDLPVCIIVGEQDFAAVNDFGVKSYQSIQQELAKAGKRTPKVVVYPQARHELILETNYEEVTADTITFLRTCLQDGKPHSRL